MSETYSRNRIAFISIENRHLSLNGVELGQEWNTLTHQIKAPIQIESSKERKLPFASLIPPIKCVKPQTVL